ncbi:MAG: hypothetical protein WC238_03445 [Parcubacteria group bacterium]|jgi:hypothetical protein
MNKKIVIGAVVVVVIILAAVFLSKRSSAPTVTEKGKDASIAKESKTDAIVGSLKDAIGLGKKMTCLSKDASGDTTAYIEGKKYKAVTVTPEGDMISLFTGEDFYSWNEKTKQGFKMTKACTDELSKNLPKADPNATTEDNFVTTEDIIAEETYNNDCKETTMAVDFSIPKDVSFMDQCELLKNLQNNIPANLKDLQIPGQ